MAEGRELTRTEALLVNLLDNPDDDLARYAFADYVTEYDARNAPALVKAELVMALKTLHEYADRGGYEAAYDQLNDALTDPALDFGMGRRVEAQVRALASAGMPCCERSRRTRRTCRCLSDAVSCDLRLGFVDVLRLSFTEVLHTTVLTEALRHNPLKKLVVTDAALEVEIDRWFDGPEHNGWQVYFYNSGPPLHGRSDYFHMEGFEFRDEVVDNIAELLSSVVYWNSFLHTGTETGRVASNSFSNRNRPRRRRGQA